MSRRSSPAVSETRSAHVHGQPATTLDLEARLNRMEATLQSIVQSIPRNDSSSNRNSVEPQQADDNDGFQGMTTYAPPPSLRPARAHP